MACNCSCKEPLVISRGTTVPITLTVKSNNIDLTGASQVWLSFFQNGEKILRLTIEDLTLESKTISATLTEGQTLAFKSIPAQMQMRAVLSDGRKIAQQPPTSLEVLDILDDGEIV